LAGLQEAGLCRSETRWFEVADSSLFVNDPGVVLVILSEARILFHAGIVVIFSSSDLALDLRHGNEGNHEDEHSGILRAAALA
jgi:hypothetical protein